MTRRVVQRDLATADAPPIEVTVNDHGIEEIGYDHRDLVLKGLEESRRGEIASDEEVQAVLARFRR